MFFKVAKLWGKRLPLELGSDDGGLIAAKLAIIDVSNEAVMSQLVMDLNGKYRG